MTLLFVADHASAHVPPDIDLGIPDAWLADHIAVDIGTAALTAALQAQFAAPAVVAAVSRLVIDLNREPERVDLIPVLSDGRRIDGNVGLTPAERQRRIDTYFTPYHAAVSAAIARHRPLLIVSVHSFTPALASRDEARPWPWPIGILYNHDDRAARTALAWLSERQVNVGDNLPYSGRDLNYTMNRHAEANGIAYLGIEIRQDLLADVDGIAKWTARLAALIEHVRLTLMAPVGQDSDRSGEAA